MNNNDQEQRVARNVVLAHWRWLVPQQPNVNGSGCMLVCWPKVQADMGVIAIGTSL